MSATEDTHCMSSCTGDTFAVAGADGSFYLVTKKGRIEKTVAAHEGAMTSLRWNHDGSALVTGNRELMYLCGRQPMHGSALC